MAVSHEDVRRIAALARLAVPDDRLDALTTELSGILAHVDALARVPREDTDGRAVADAEVHTASVAAIRLAEDTGPSVPLSAGPEAFAPAWRDGFFLVPRLDTHGEPSGGDEPDHTGA